MTTEELELADSFSFEEEGHRYLVDGGRQVISVSQVIKAAGLISFDGIPVKVLDFAKWRGNLSHEVCAHHDRGVDVVNEFDIPIEVLPRFDAWALFCVECNFVPFPDQVEVARVVTVAGIQYGMKPDVVGLLDGVPAVVERKNTALPHPSWGVQLSGYEAGLPRPVGYRHYKRVAVQLKGDGTYKLHIYDSPDDWPVFQHSHAVASWKLNHRLIKLAA